ncbi:MAG: hypothetical protein AB7O88_26070 [Reyranellaceae bacterium]
MPDVNMGGRIKDRVREFFQKGYKSSNKLYAIATDGSVDLALWNTIQLKAATRWNDALASRALRLGYAASYYDLAQALVRVPMEDRAGNCGEQAALAAWFLLKSEFLRRNRIYTVEITHPGDHALCLVSQAPIPEAGRTFASVGQFVRSSVARSYLVIDPWLNTCCSADQYLLMGGQKLDKWQADGKRVSWHAGSQGPGWYPPGGEYKNAFALAPLEIHPF